VSERHLAGPGATGEGLPKAAVPAHRPARSRLAVADTLGPLVPAWEELADRVEAPPFLWPGWIDSWWRAFGTGRLEIVTLERAGRLVGLIPLQRRFGRLRSTSNWHSPSFGMLAEDEATGRELTAGLVQRMPAELSLGFIPTGPELAAYHSAATRAGCRVLQRTLERSPFVDIEGPWEAYRQRLSRHRRSELGRLRRRLGELGDLRLEVADGRERLEDLLDEVFSVEASGWKAARGTAITSRPHTRRFYIDVARWAARRGWLRLAFLRLDGRPLAVQYLLEVNGVHYAIKGGYDPGAERFSPGILLLEALLERAFSTGAWRFTLLGGDEPYKVTFANGNQELVLFQAFASSVTGSLHRATWAYVRPLAKRAQVVFDRSPGAA
jgi:CelD/BcsL family acetyltransferase involved in cellulose biosynthesis